MRILYVVQHFVGPSAAGSSRAYENARRLVGMGHEVTLLCGRLDRNSPKDSVDAAAAGIDLRMADVAYAQSMSNARRLWTFRRYMSWAVRVGRSLPRPDVVLASSTPLTVGEIGARIARHHGIPFVFEVRDLWPEVPIAMGALRLPWLRFLARRMARRIYARADRVVVLSTDMGRVVESWGVEPGRIEVVPNSCDLEAFGSEDARRARDGTRHRLGWSDRFVCLHPGAMGRVNGLDFAVDAGAALDRAGESGILIALMGEGNQRARLQARVEREAIRSVAFFPPVPKREMAKILAGADVGLVTVAPLPYLETNSANKFFDFLAAGLPVVLNYGGWQAQVLRETGAGIDVNPRKPEELADRLRRLRDDDAMRGGMGTAARALAESRYDRDRLARKLERVLREAGEADPDRIRGRGAHG